MGGAVLSGVLDFPAHDVPFLEARMHLRALVAGSLSLFALSALSAPLRAQDSTLVARAESAYVALDFSEALALARRATTSRLAQGQMARAYEVLAFSYAALDSTRQAVEAFRELIFLAPDREPSVERVSPRITSLYASALGQVLVVRGLDLDSSSFVGGQGAVPVRFAISRPASVLARLVGGGLDIVVDSQLAAGSSGFRWEALQRDGTPVPAGRYRILLTAREGASEFTAETTIDVRHAPVDTLPHLTSLPGYTNLPRTEVPPRDWKPFGLSALYTGLTTGAAFALSNGDLGNKWSTPALAVSLTSLTTGLVMALRKPDEREVPANIRYNDLLATQIAQRNVQLAAENATRRRQTALTIMPVETAGAGADR
ncbi:MAG: hypothetical protein KA761_08360 [Gemmatimonadaceae bacterium]|nr:hypothetical protein [Gemmatimonadaceae bacterium]